MMTATLQIGNSDDKLPQRDWAMFVYHVGKLVDDLARQVHFSSASIGHAIWQNYCWVFEIKEDRVEELEKELVPIRQQFLQDSVALTLGDTKFI